MPFPRETLVSGVSLVNTLTLGVQSLVSHEAWTGQDVFGADTYAAPVSRLAVIDRTNKVQVRDAQTVTIAATITFIGDVLPNGAAGRREPIDPRDIITLPDGFTGPIIDSPNSVIDPVTGRGFIQEVMLGAR